MGITHEWNGTVLTITSDSGTSSADLKGDKGDTGVRGPQGAHGNVEFTDLTDEQKAELAGIGTLQPLYSTEVTQEAFDAAGEEGITLVTVGNSDVDLTPYNEIVVSIKIPDTSTVNETGNMLYIYMTPTEAYSASDIGVWLRPQSSSIARNCELSIYYNNFVVRGFWHEDNFLYGQVAHNGYRASYGYAGGMDSWTQTPVVKSEKRYFHIFGSKKTFKFPVGTKVEVYGRLG